MYMYCVHSSVVICVCLKADAKKKKMDRDDEERSQQMIEDQIVRAMAAKKVRKRERERGTYFSYYVV